MSHFDDFFKANYRRMVGYCSSFCYSEADVEEVVADVILKYYDEYRSKISGPTPDVSLRHWMSRRVLLNLKSRYSTHGYTKAVPLDAEHDTGTADDPEAILDLKQRLPEVHPILITYEAFGNAVATGEGKTERRARGENSSADKTRFCRERKKFLSALAGHE